MVAERQHRAADESGDDDGAALHAGGAGAAQFPLIELLGPIGARVYLAGLAVSVVCIYGLTAACAWAPSRLASSVVPAEALRYE